MRGGESISALARPPAWLAHLPTLKNQPCLASQGPETSLQITLVYLYLDQSEKVKSESLSVVTDSLQTSWPVHSMEFSRPEY